MIAQNRNPEWQMVSIGIVPNANLDCLNGSIMPTYWHVINGGVSSIINSQPTNLNLSNSIPSGTTYTGCLWAKYQINTSSTIQYAEIGAVWAKAVKT